MITTADGIIHTAQPSIRSVLYEYYKNLYTEPVAAPSINIQASQNNPPSATLTTPLTTQNILAAIKASPLNKSPGADGIPVEFYIAFWSIIEREMVEIMNALMTSPVIPSDICLGIMVLIPKIACPKTALDYRPITLLNSDYKIFMRCMKTRLSTIFPHVIGPHQQCLVAGRNILNATCAIRDSISVAKQNKQNHMLISLDFDHAFDRVRHNYLLQRMMELNIDPAFIACLRNIMAVSNSKLLVNGHLTQAFPVERSVRQGCPLSMHLFALTLDPLLQNISCIYPMNTDTIIRAYADDVTIVAVDATILPRMYQCIQQYSRETGAQLNEKKTKAMYIGKEDKIPLPSWLSIHSSIKILGVTFFNDLSQTIRYNWNSVTNAVRHVLSAQKFRFADLVKRAQYINTYALSKAWYMAQILPIPSLIGKKLRSATG
ncbi:hypothetical protein ANN_10715 [Periplaneta americana]|nr:hypothetical protein ANN_10715 [Periplaneta americana]